MPTKPKPQLGIHASSKEDDNGNITYLILDDRIAGGPAKQTLFESSGPNLRDIVLKRMKGLNNESE